MLDTGLAGKVALVTGANHGIGAAAARALAAQSAAVLVHYWRLADKVSGPDPSAEAGPGVYAAARARDAGEVVAAIRRAGGRAEAAEWDLADPASVPALFDAAERAFGPVAVLVNNAAYWTGDTFIPLELYQAPAERWSMNHTITPQTFDPHFAVNTRATALLMAEFLRRRIEHGARWGRIINLSTGGAACFPGEVSYGASKAAIEAISRSAAKEMGPYGITVNIVSPGPTQTGWITPDLERALLPSIPLGRVGTPEDIADVIVFLASEQARWLTGQLLQVGGGHTL